MIMNIMISRDGLTCTSAVASKAAATSRLSMLTSRVLEARHDHCQLGTGVRHHHLWSSTGFIAWIWISALSSSIEVATPPRCRGYACTRLACSGSVVKTYTYYSDASSSFINSVKLYMFMLQWSSSSRYRASVMDHGRRRAAASNKQRISHAHKHLATREKQEFQCYEPCITLDGPFILHSIRLSRGNRSQFIPIQSNPSRITHAYRYARARQPPTTMAECIRMAAKTYKLSPRPTTCTNTFEVLR